MPKVVCTLVALCPVLIPASAQDRVSTDAAAAPSKATRFDYHSVRGRQPLISAPDRYEGEIHFEITGKSRVQGLKHFGDQWSGDTHLLWDGPVGASMSTAFELEADGVFDVAIQLTAAPDYGVLDLTLNGRPVRQGIDTYGPKVDLAPLIVLKEVPLKAGRQALVFKLVGANPNAHKFKNKGYLMGLDYLELRPRDTPKPEPDRPASTRTPAADDNNAAPQVAKLLASDAMPAMWKHYCYDCHSGDAVEGELHLNRFTQRASLLADIRTTQRIRNAIARREMPPQGEQQPPDAIRRQLTATLDSIIDQYLQQNPSSAPVVMRRLNRYEYNNAVRDLLQLQGDIYPLPEKTIRADHPYFDPASGRFPKVIQVGNRTLGKNQVERQILTGVSPFAIDLQAEGGFNNRGRELSVSPLLLESFLKLSRSIVNSPEFDGYCGLTSTFFSAPDESTPEQQQQLARERLTPFLERAFRRRIESSTVDRYHRFFVQRRNETNSFRQSMKDVVAAVLSSPRFLYVSESAAADADSLLDPYDIATRLSFFLWSSIPDEELLAAAQDGSLLTPEGLNAQTSRMLEDPRSQSLSQNFARQWLRLDQLITAVPDFDRFPRYYSRIGCEQWKFGLQTMIEPLLLFESIMVEDRSIMLLVDSNYSYRSDELQSWYEDQIPFGGKDNINRFNTGRQQYRRRKLKNRRHGGVITSAATLTMTSAPLRTSPIVRGAWVSTVIFNQPPPPPPDDVPEIEADDRAIEAQGLTLRQRLIQHQVNQSCVSCHSKIDPLGFALENFDAVGRWRDTYRSGLEIDATGKLFGTEQFNNVTGLKDAILDHPEWFMRAFCEHLLSYALGRELEVSDRPTVNKIVAGVIDDHGQFSTVVREIVLSPPFRHRATQHDRKASE